MPNDELELETTPNPDQQENELELDTENSEVDETTEETTPSSDPLDDIQDEGARAEAKKIRAIANRNKGKKEKTEVPTEPTKETVEEPKDILKRSDYELDNQKKAIRLATVSTEQDSEEAQALKANMKENWQEVRQFYTPRRGKGTPEDILEDIKDAYAVFTSRKPKEEVTPDTSELTETKATGTGATPPAKPKAKDPKNFKLPRQPDEWYK